MKLSVCFISIATLCLFAILPCSGQSVSDTKIVGPGVTWNHQFVAEVPLNYNIMRVELDNPLVTIETESGNDVLFKGEKVLSSTKREAEPGRTNIIGGVNADFWVSNDRLYTPVGLLVADGMIYNMPSSKRSAFVLTKDERPYIGPVTLKVSLQDKSHSISIPNINSPKAPKGEIVLYTPPYGSHLSPSAGNRYVLTMEGHEFLPNQPTKVKAYKVNSSTTTTLGSQTIVLQVPDSQKGKSVWIKDGAELTLVAQMSQVGGVVASVCGGGPVIVQDGRPKVADEGTGKAFIETKHPRTAVGYSKDGNTIYLLTVDGRQPKVSIGASLEDLGKVMAKLGCWRAMNLDGGGSTTMVVNDNVVNKPSDVGGPRTVANSLLIVATTQTGSTQTSQFHVQGSPE